MLTTNLNSPQHKRMLRMKNNWENESSLSTIYRTYKTNKNLITLKRFKQIHLELIKCARIINETYGLHILISISVSIFAISNICETTMTEKYILILLIFLYAVVTGDILCELYDPSTSKTFRDEIRDFTFQLIQNRLTFTACGFYDLDHTFIYNAISFITTYLVILMQIGDKPKVFFDDTNYNSTSITERMN
ncbi:uncharacterized protein LOC122627291 [Vespula pensylvanica]|uniref:uncharacterized protein LOC122627291 n=1 Tax=Vespula pensylvanica TaxID=30213 RepID=UPI001CBA433D|nr:uncharacterized protein LOC122627291 [Vespula pensylvanica]